MESKDIIQFFTSILGQIKLYHWTTPKYSKHIALDKLHEELSEKVDLFIEAFVGKYKKQPFDEFTIVNKSTSDVKNIEKFLYTKRTELESLYKKFNKAPEFQNIIQDMMSLIDRALYLCNLE